MAQEIPSDPQRDSFSVPGVVAGAYRFVFANRRAFLALAIIPMVVIMSGNALFFCQRSAFSDRAISRNQNLHRLRNSLFDR